MIYPKILKKGDTIGIIAPCSYISDNRTAECRAVVESMGYKVKMADNLAVNFAGFMADTGAVRGEWINRMFADPDIDAIFCVRGGSGGSSCMEHLDLELIKNNPKIFVGYSDVTSMHLAFNQQCGFVTFHGPMVSSNMVSNFDEESNASFFNALNCEESYQFKNTRGHTLSILKEGRAEGILVGGNLALLSASMGTPYEVDTKGKILFIEDTSEEISRLYRFAYQLRNSCKFRDCVGVILGQFTDCSNVNQPDFLEVECFRNILEDFDIPVMYNVQSGHGFPMMTLPLGALCKMDTTDPSITICRR